MCGRADCGTGKTAGRVCLRSPHRLMQESKEIKRRIAGIRRWLLFELRLLFFPQRPQKPLKRLLPFVRSYTFIWATAYKIFWIDALRAPKVAAPPAGNSRKVLPAPQSALPRRFTVIRKMKTEVLHLGGGIKLRVPAMLRLFKGLIFF